MNRIIKLDNRTLVLRFGAIGDFVSALSFCNARPGYDLFFASSVNDFFLGRQSSISKLLQFVSIADTTVVNFGTLSELIIVVRAGRYDRILIYSQGAKGLKLRLTAFALATLSRMLFGKRLIVKKFFHGGQYFHLLNGNSQVKTIALTLPEQARISIFYDSKESANNLSLKTISAIISTLARVLRNPVISLYGATRIEIAADCGLRNLSGQTTLDDLSAVFRETDLAITCDSGPLHVFSARGVPCIAFMSARQELLNWTPFTSKNHYIFDDTIECLGCQKAVCPRGENLCVNSEITRAQFSEIFD